MSVSPHSLRKRCPQWSYRGCPFWSTPLGVYRVRKHAKGCLIVMTKRVRSGVKRRWKNRILMRCGGDFSSKTGAERSQYLAHASKMWLRFWSDTSGLLSVMYDFGSSPNRNSPPCDRALGYTLCRCCPSFSGTPESDRVRVVDEWRKREVERGQGRGQGRSIVCVCVWVRGCVHGVCVGVGG